MQERKFKIIGHAKNCQIRNKITSRLKLAKSEIELGENLDIMLNLQFDPDDVPNEISISAELPDGFKSFDPITVNVTEALEGAVAGPERLDEAEPDNHPSETGEEEINWEDDERKAPELEVPMSFKYSEADTGVYTIEFVLTHAEYGTELSVVENLFLTIKPPTIKLIECTADNPEAIKGAEVIVRAKVESSSPLKFRGIMGGEVYTDDESVVHRRYELSTKRIAIIGAKELSWNFKIPNDETGTGKFNVEMEFASKDTATNKVFENIFTLKKAKAMKVVKFESSNWIVSEEDKVRISANLENVGIEQLTMDAKLKIILPSDEEFVLPSIQARKIEPGKQELMIWDWTVPAGTKLGKAKGVFTLKMLDVDETREHIEGLFEVKSCHDYSITSVITDKDYYRIGDPVKIKAFFKDSGTRSGDRAQVDFILVDIFGKEVFKETATCRIDSTETVKEWGWTIPEQFDSGVYDIQFLIEHEEEVVAKKNFPKLLNIDVPVRLKLHLVLPEINKGYSHLTNYLREQEKVIKTQEHHKLSIHTLNSNTWLYTLNDVVIYGMDFNIKEELNKFKDTLFSFIITNTKFSKKHINSMLKLVDGIGICWSADTHQAAKRLEIKKLNKFKLKKDNWPKLLAHLEAVGRDNISKALTSALKASEFSAKNVQVTLGVLDFFGLWAGPKTSPSTKITRMRNDTIATINKLSGLKLEQPSKKLLADALAPWLKNARSVRIAGRKDTQTFYHAQFIHGVAVLKLIEKMLKLLESYKKNNYFSIESFSNYILYQILYYLTLIEFDQNRLRYDPYCNTAKVKVKIKSNLKLINSLSTDTAFLFDKWRNRLVKYQRNMTQRRVIAAMRDNLKITVNPVEINGMKGDKAIGKIMLGNSGEMLIRFNAYFALPSKSWSLIEPETITTRDGVSIIKRTVVDPKQTIELPISILFPKTLTFKNYSAIMKIEPIIGKIKSEV